MSNTPNQTVEERESTYGEFKVYAEISQALTDVLYDYVDPVNMEDDQIEALEMIFRKIARILNGDPHYVDNWHDIGGYAYLVEKRLLNERSKPSYNFKKLQDFNDFDELDDFMD